MYINFFGEPVGVDGSVCTPVLAVAASETCVSALGCGWRAGGGVDGGQMLAALFERCITHMGLVAFGSCARISYALLAADHPRYFL
jgi:hypothetical protein